MSVLTHDDDRQLLRQYAESGSHSAFAELVAVHTDLVYSAARRQVGGDPHLAADVTQAVFLVLARKAATIGPGVALSGWLFRTTRYAASVALRSQERRRYHERRAAMLRREDHDSPSHVEQGGDMWQQVEPLLDEAIDRLNAADRAAVILRYFQRKSLRQVGEELMISEDTAQKRVSRAIERLKHLLGKRGATVGSVAGLAIALGENAVQAAPTEVSAALSAVAAGQAAAPAAATTLSTAVASGLSAIGAKIVLAVVVIVLLFASLASIALWPKGAPPVNASGPTTFGPATVLLGEAPLPSVLDLGNGVTLELVGIPPAIFTQGGELRGPPHSVTIGYSFHMGRYEVTQAQWARVMGNNPSQFKGDDRRPVEQVSWDECQEFCLRLSRITGQKVRLPSESEWEHACRAGTSTIWHFGNDAGQLNLYSWNGLVGVYSVPEVPRLVLPAILPPGNSGGSTHPVGLKLGNPWGLYDMYGNVFEWCQDVGHPTERYDDRHPTDGRPRTVVGVADERIIRGRSFGDCWLQETFSDYNWSRTRDYRDLATGLRVVVEVASAPGL